jgi:UDP-N-acetylglucosamine 2-epimerase (non-hydrolysing)
MVVAGARPNFMKIAPMLAELDRVGKPSVLVHTGQHYDDRMSDSFFRDLDIRRPDFNLGVGSGTHAAQTARIMTEFEPVLREVRPSWVVVPGDVNSTLACALVTVKLKEELDVRIAHLEAGLRSNDWRMPEEVNRVLADRCSDLLLTPSPEARGNLMAEGIAEDRIVFVGNVMIDTLLNRLPAARERDVARQLELPRDGFVLTTLHRPSNVDDPATLKICLTALGTIARKMPVVLPLHPRTRKQIETFGLGPLLSPLRVVEPFGYIEMLSMTDASSVVVTDSGGVQEESTVLGVPCVTLRESTERPVTVEQGTNRLAPWPLTVDGIVKATDDALARGRRTVGACSPDGWDGKAAQRAIAALGS